MQKIESSLKIGWPTDILRAKNIKIKAVFNQGLALTLFSLGFATRYTMMAIKSILAWLEKV